MEIIERYFPHLSEKQKEQFGILLQAFPEWNGKINLVSRRDMENLELAHVLHSLAIGKYIRFSPESRVMDLGCGGGLPGLPLAILYPDVSFHLIDRIGKKVNAARAMADEAGLTNVTFQHGDSGECHEKFDFVVSRAVMPQSDILKAVRKNISPVQRNSIPNGIITLKGGDLDEELKNLKKTTIVTPVSNYFSEEFFKTKKIVYTRVP